MTYIDAHIHYFDSPGFIENLLREMDRCEIEKSVMLPTLGDSIWEYVGMTFKEVDNRAMYQVIKHYPDRFIGAVRVVPNAAGAIDELHRYADTGMFRLAKLSPPEGFTMDDPSCYPFYEECSKLGFPILIHMGQTGGEYIGEKKRNRYQLNSSLGRPLSLDAVAKAFPELTFIMAHNGYPYMVEAWAVAANNPNVYLDISGSGPWVDSTPIVHSALGGNAFIPIDLNKVIWGSDNCLPQDESIQRATAYMRLMGADRSQRQAIFGDTARKLYHL